MPLQTAKTVVKKAKYGSGLFANQDIKHERLVKDRKVVAGYEYKGMSNKKWDAYWQKHDIPEDAAIGFLDKKLYDPTFTSMKNVPKWYRQNHSYNNSVELRKKGKNIVFTTVKDIKKGDEIRFYYKYPDPSWSKDE